MHQAQAGPPQDIAALAIRVETLTYKAEAHERAIEKIEQRFADYARTKENELQLLALRNELLQIQRDVSENKHDINENKKEMNVLKDKLDTADKDSQTRNFALEKKWLYGILGGGFTIIVAIVSFLLSRLF
jgi:predicted RNase H-like nuclease (RuvC/YqgF family)